MGENVGKLQQSIGRDLSIQMKEIEDILFDEISQACYLFLGDRSLSPLERLNIFMGQFASSVICYS